MAVYYHTGYNNLGQVKKIFFCSIGTFLKQYCKEMQPFIFFFFLWVCGLGVVSFFLLNLPFQIQNITKKFFLSNNFILKVWTADGDVIKLFLPLQLWRCTFTNM